MMRQSWTETKHQIPGGWLTELKTGVDNYETETEGKTQNLKTGPEPKNHE